MPFAIFKYPHSQLCTKVEQYAPHPKRLFSCHDLEGQEGYAFAPFSISEDEPLLLISPDEVTTLPLTSWAALHDGTTAAPALFPIESEAQRKTTYRKDFEAFHQALCQQQFEKLVLARSETLNCDAAENLDPMRLFIKACQLYPSQYVALVSAPDCGTWLMATPEVLLQKSADKWHTMSLAGTHKGTKAWENKNIAEQDYVTQYIAERLADHAQELRISSPQTAEAGALTHIRTDFEFALRASSSAAQLLDTLYPTPAVCGLPKAEAKDFILAHESTPRSYYSGFAGAYNLHTQTHLYVTLRCMKITDHGCQLYAGGGLLPASEVEKEWQETQAKLETMKSCIATK